MAWPGGWPEGESEAASEASEPRASEGLELGGGWAVKILWWGPSRAGGLGSALWGCGPSDLLPGVSGLLRMDSPRLCRELVRVWLESLMPAAPTLPVCLLGGPWHAFDPVGERAAGLPCMAVWAMPGSAAVCR